MLTIKMNDKESVSIMLDIQERKLLKYLTVFTTLAICAMRPATAVGELAMGIALLLGIFLWYSNKTAFSILDEEIKGYMKAYGVFVLLTIPSILVSDSLVTSIKDFFGLWIWRYVVFVIIAVFIKRREYLVNMLAAFLAVSSVECLFTLLEVLNHIRTDGRGWGFGGNPLILSGVMCMLLPVVVVILMDPGFEKKLKKISVFAVISILVGLLCNKSRGAWLTELIVIPVATYRYVKKNKFYLAVMLAVFFGIAGFMVSSPQYMQRVKSITNITTERSNADRIWAWRSALDMLREHPATGVGFGQFKVRYLAEYKYAQESQKLTHAHNNFLQVSAENGIIGLAGFLYFIGYYLYRSMRNYCINKNPYDILVFTIFFGFICLFGMIDYSLGFSTGIRTMWFLLAILLQLKKTERQYCETE